MSHSLSPLPKAPWLAEILIKRRSFEHARWRKQFDDLDVQIGVLNTERQVACAVADDATASYLALFGKRANASVLVEAGLGLTAHSWTDNVVLFGLPERLGRVYADAVARIAAIDVKIASFRRQIEQIAMEHVDQAALIESEFFLEFDLDRYAA
jgi:hypothetical protein